MRRTLQTAASLAIAVIAAGCQFTTPDGRSLDLRRYDSILVEDVQLAPEVSEKKIGPLLKGYTAVAALESRKWKLAGDFDLDAFTRTVEEYATMSGTIDGKPVEPLMTRDQFLKERSEAKKRWKARLAEPKGTRTVSLRIHVTELRFPDALEGVTMGTNPRMRCRVDVYADDRLLGSGDMEAIAGVPGVPLLPASMVGRAAKAMIFDEYTRETVLKLVAELGEETIGALGRTK
ncbi:MAG TPA: hypothetical protein VLM89_02110 [Phycisphaerae bacterium]|nr:hypothetical protein [Phycisphaerae bacterium]